jgi:lipopolysaccharide cholinephosphotransferase
MSELQLKLLCLLKFFHEFCVSNQIKYFALGGTLLGAVRHKGYIPWDDDIDIGIPREDYDKFIKLAKSEDLGHYQIEVPFENKDYIYPYCKLYDTSTTLIENTRYKTKRGIFLDIFPLDGIGNTLEESKNNYKIINKQLNLMSTKVCAIRKGRKLYKNVSIIIARCIPNFIYSWHKCIKKIDKLSRSRPYEEFEYIGNLVGNWNYKEIAKKEWFGDGKLYDFESLKIYGPTDADSYLKNVYGDYMKLPPKEKQVTHHDYIELDLNKSYK